MLNDGSQPYDQNKDGGDSKLAGCPIDFRGRDHAYARIVVQVLCAVPYSCGRKDS
jgi:hypothetical protein